MAVFAGHFARNKDVFPKLVDEGFYNLLGAGEKKRFDTTLFSSLSDKVI